MSKKKLILVAASELFLKFGYGNSSMEAIAEKAGVTKATLYNNFQSKEQLFLAMAQNYRELKHVSYPVLPTTVAKTINKMQQELAKFYSQCYNYFIHDAVGSLTRMVIAELPFFPQLDTIYFSLQNPNVEEILSEYLRVNLAAFNPLLSEKSTWLSLQLIDMIRGQTILLKLLHNHKRTWFVSRREEFLRELNFAAQRLLQSAVTPIC